MSITFEKLTENVFHMRSLLDYCIDAIEDQIPDAVINSNKQGAPHIVNFSLPGISNLEVVKYLDSEGICISSAAACKSNHTRGPTVLESLGLSRDLADSALRVSFSPMNTLSDVDALIETVIKFMLKHRH